MPEPSTSEPGTSGDTVINLNGISVLACDPNGPVLRTDRDAIDLVGAALSQDAELVAVPAQRLGEEFFTLRTRVAGEIVQKFVNYRLRLAVVGDISGHVAASAALRDFVTEANRGTQLWFVATPEELAERLGATAR